MGSLQRFLNEGRLKHQPTNRAEIEGLFSVARRDLADAQVVGLSADRRFATAYNAALQLATVVLRSEGYRTSGQAHHWVTLTVLPALMNPKMQSTADYLNACRSKRNTVDYDGIGIATEREVAELIAETERFRDTVDAWLRESHPELIEERDG